MKRKTFRRLTATLTCKKGIGCGYDKKNQHATLNIYGTGKIVATGKNIMRASADETTRRAAISIFTARPLKQQAAPTVQASAAAMSSPARAHTSTAAI